MKAANFAIRSYPAVKKFYQRKRAKRGATVAIKAIAHKLSRACYHVLKSGEEFEMNKLFILKCLVEVINSMVVCLKTTRYD